MHINDKKIIVDICQLLLNNEVDFIEGCRKVVSVRNQLNLQDDHDFLPFVGVTSETDDYPDINIRENFSEDYLKQVDEEVFEYILLVRPSIFEACKVLICKYMVE